MRVDQIRLESHRITSNHYEGISKDEPLFLISRNQSKYFLREIKAGYSGIELHKHVSNFQKKVCDRFKINDTLDTFLIYKKMIISDISTLSKNPGGNFEDILEEIYIDVEKARMV